MFATKSTEKIPDPCNNKEHYQSFLRKKKTKFVKKLMIITQQPKSIESSKTIDIKSVTIVHPKTSYKLFKTRRQDKKVFQVFGAGKKSSHLYIVKRRNIKTFFPKKIQK